MKNVAIERFVEFPNAKGKTLRGMVHLPAGAEKQPVPGVVMFHGFTGHRIESHWMFVKCSRTLARAGIASLRFDFYGTGESAGEFREMTLAGEVADGRAAVSFLRAQAGIDPERWGLVGLSLGGLVAATLAHGLGPRALVLWSAVAHTSRLAELVKKSARRIPGRPGALEFEAHEISPRLVEDVLGHDPIRHLTRYKGPTLIVHPENDEVIPISHARDFYWASGAIAKELAIVAGADHVYSSIAWEEEVIQRTVLWFRRHL